MIRRTVLHIGIPSKDWPGIDAKAKGLRADAERRGITKQKFLETAMSLERSSQEYQPHSEGFTILWKSFFRGLPKQGDERIVGMVIPEIIWKTIKERHAHLYMALLCRDRDHTVKLFIVNVDGVPERLPERV